MRHFDGLHPTEFALVVLAVADDDNGVAHGMVSPPLAQLVAAGAVDGVVERRASAILQALHSGFEQFDVVGEVLGDGAVAGESHDERPVEVKAQSLLEKTCRGRLLKVETAVHRAAGINQQAQFEGQVGFAPEIDDGLRRLVVVQDGKVRLVQVADKLAVVVGRDKQDIDFIHPGFDGKDWIPGRVVIWIGRGERGHGDAGRGIALLRPQGQPGGRQKDRDETKSSAPCTSFPTTPKFAFQITASGFLY